MQFLNDETQTTKKKWYKRPVVLVALVLIAAFIGGCSWVAYEVIFTPSSAVDIPRYRGERTAISHDSDNNSNAQENWFNTHEEVLDGIEYGLEALFISDPIVAKTSDDDVEYVLRFAVFDKNNVSGPGFLASGIRQQNGRYSYDSSISFFAEADLNGAFSTSYKYETEEIRVAEYIDRSIDNISRSKTGTPFAYFGVSESPKIGEMTILGEHPEGIVEYAYEDITYYFWYYSELPILEYLLESDDFDFGGYTLREMIEVLEIKTPGE